MTKELPEMFRYTRPKLPDDAIFSISPSQVDRFFSDPAQWYREQVLGEEQKFKGNTASVLGTVAHYIYASVTLGKEISREYINSQLEAFNEIMGKEIDLDLPYVLTNYPLVVNKVVNGYVIPQDVLYPKALVEHEVVAEVLPGIYISGTCDRIEGDCLTDYKNVGTKPNEYVIPSYYKSQLLTYAIALRLKGIEINRIRIVYGVRPTKTLPARYFKVTEVITHEDEKYIMDTIKLISESVVKVKEDPSLAHLIFKSYDLKGN